MYSIHLNNKVLRTNEVKKIFKSVQNMKILKKKGGYLFKSSLNKTDFHIGIIPVLIEGERSHHYDIKLDYEDEYEFTGFFNTDGTIGILFSLPKQLNMTENISVKIDFLEKIKIIYTETADLLIKNGLSERMKLDWISRKIIDEADLFEPIPEFLGNLAGH